MSPLNTFSFFFLFIEFIEKILVNKIIHVTSAQFYNTLSVYCTVCLPPQVKFLSITIYPPYPPPPPLPFSLPPTIASLLFVSVSFFSVFFFLNLSTTALPLCSPRPTQLSACCLPMGLSLFCLLVNFVH